MTMVRGGSAVSSGLSKPKIAHRYAITLSRKLAAAMSPAMAAE
jgi:hypothetical protein